MARVGASLIVGSFALALTLGITFANQAAVSAPVPHAVRAALPYSATTTPPPSTPTGTALRPPETTSPERPATILTSALNESDPFLLADHGHYDLYASSQYVDGKALNVPVQATSNFSVWSAPVDAMPTLPTWAVPNFFYLWSPDVHRFGATYRLYFTAQVQHSDPAIECIGSATGPSATGPFVPDPAPFVCQPDLGGSIDPRVFVDQSGTPWLLWKSDQNIGGASTPTTIWIQQLDPSGTELYGHPSALLTPDETWQGTIVEAPDLVEINGVFLLLYSANWFNSDHYGIGVATCTSVTGPCSDASKRPLISSNAQGKGPGEASFFTDQSGLWVLYSPQRSTAPAPQVQVRTIGIVRLGVDSFGPYLADGGPPPPLGLLLTPSAWPG